MKLLRKLKGRRRVEQEDARRIVREVEDLAVQRDGRLVERDERRVVRVLDDAAVAPGGAGGDPVRVVDRDAGAVLGEERGGRAADDPRAGDVDVHAGIVAARGLRRLLGLAFRDDAEPLWIPRCRSVHTFGMRFALDLVWLDASARVVRVDHGVPPRRMRTCLRARSVLELPAE